ncbi:gliding motility-associated C-terminal domain-containing protein, partial [Pedobacter steynii]
VVVTENGCPSPASAGKVVTVNLIPGAADVEVTEGNLTFCTGDQVVLKSNKTAGNQWYKNGIIIDGATSQSYTANTSGTYTVVVTENGCPSPASAGKVVTVNLIPLAADVEVTEGNLTFCTGDQVILKSNKTTGNQWYKNGIIIDGATSQSYTANTSGTYTVVVTENGCPSPASAGKVVTVNPIPTIPTITAGTPTSFCDGGSTILTSSSLTGNQWYKEGILIPSATAKTYTATESGNYTLTVTSRAGCISPISLPTTVTEVPYPVTPGISPSNTTTFCEGGIVTLTSTSSFGNQWYKNGILIPNATNPTYDVNTIGVYTVKVTNTTGCTSPVSGSTTVTVTPVPKGFDDNLSPLTCTQFSFSYQLQTNINNTLKGGNAVPSSFTWTVNSPVLGAVNGTGNTINATLINTSTSPQEVVYTVTPRALTGGCDGVPFKIKISVPVCLGISITKTADRNYVSSAGDKINYTITVKNTGTANHNQVVVNDPLTGGVLSNPTGDNGNRILEKDESWIYRTSYTLTQFDLDNNGAPSANIRKVQNVAMVQSAEVPIPSADVADVAIRQRPVIRLVKTGVLNSDYKTINYTFLITNRGNVTLRDLELTDPKIPGLLISGPAILAPGASTTVRANYTITEAEKKAGIVRNTATATGAYRPGDRVSDISGTNENNDDPTVIDVVRYPAAVDDFAKTKADVEVMVPVANNDRPSLFPLDVSTIDVKTQPLHGVLQMNKDGKIIYQPNKGYSGVEKFTYMINDENGLRSNIAVVTINVVPPDLEIPNTFTPNGDGRNDTFQVKGRENYDSIEISIFNRWGDEVYRSKNYKDEWDGAGLNEGTYFYVLKLKKGSQEESRRSWVLIKR